MIKIIFDATEKYTLKSTDNGLQVVYNLWLMSKKAIVRHVCEIPTHALEGLDPVLKRIYWARGVRATHDLEKQLKFLLPYHNLKNIDQASALLYTALIQKKRILIVGDFDGDGATSTALAVLFFKALGADIHYLVPNRFTYSYGLSEALVETAALLHPDVLVTVDSGISCCPGVLAAKNKGMQVLVTDHHLPGAILPEADCIVNPNLPGDLFASKNLAGVGVIFYVLLALRAKLKSEHWFEENRRPELNMAQFLDLVALGTVTDVVPLDRNNRILVYQGLMRMRAGQTRPGIKALLKMGKKNIQTVCASDLGFAVGPRLNAAGRLDDMSLGIACLLEADPIRALQMAERLDELNQTRKQIEQDMKADALAHIEKMALAQEMHAQQPPVAFCLFQSDWHQGVIGIVASRMKELYHRPVIVFAKDNERLLKGSCRSIEGLNIRDVLQMMHTRAPGLIHKFGGHAMAAGLTIEVARLDEFRQLLLHTVSECVAAELLAARYQSDGALEPQHFGIDFITLLKNAGPWGSGFSEPLFDGVFEIVRQRVINGQHISLLLMAAGGTQAVSGILFYAPEALINHMASRAFYTQPQKVHLVYRLDINVYQGAQKPQLLIEQIDLCWEASV